MLLWMIGHPLAVGLRAQPYTSQHLEQPIEVMSATFPHVRVITVDLERDATRFQLTANNLNFDGKGRVRIDDGSWVTFDNASVTCDARSRQPGCVGFPGTITFTVPIDVAAGRHTVQFENSKTDGFTSGYRVLDLDFGVPYALEAGSPVYDAGDAKNGEALFHAQNRWTDQPGSSDRPAVPQVAACADCHVEGRDLKYFGYSDHALVVRTVFHGGSVEDGEDIAAYIRGLDVPTLGTPWDPPYQPGPGMDDKPVIEWAAGAGLDAVVEEEEVRGYLFGADGITRDDFDEAPNHRELPLSAALPDWKDWLPRQWPGECHSGSTVEQSSTDERSSMDGQSSTDERSSMDGQSSTDEQSSMWVDALSARDAMMEAAAGDDATKFHNAINAFAARSSFLKKNHGQCTSSDEAHLTAMWSAMAWRLGQVWYAHHKYGWEDRGNEASGYGPARSWTQRGRHAFDLGPHVANVNGLSNPPFLYATRSLDSYMTHLWYQLQVVVNPGLSDARASGQSPVDWGYQNSFLNGHEAPWRSIASRMLQLHAMSDQPCRIAGGDVAAGNATCLGDQAANPYWLASVYGWDNKTSAIFDSMPEADKLRIVTFGLDWYLSRLEMLPADDRASFARGDKSSQWKDATYNPQTGDQKHTRAYDIADMWWVRSATLKTAGVPDAIMRRWDALGERLWPAADWESLGYPGNPDLPAVDPNAESDREPEPDPLSESPNR
jgi:hypothetical protein